MKAQYSLRFKLTVLYLLTVIIPVLIIVTAMPYYYQRLISQESQVLTQGTLAALTGNIETYLDDLERLTITPYLDTDIIYALKLKASGRFAQATPNEKLVANRALTVTLANFLTNTRHDILGTLLKPLDGSAYISSNNPTTNPLSNYNYKQQKWYKKAVKADGDVAFISPHKQDYLTSPAQKQVFSVARLIKDPDSQQPLAVIMADANSAILDNLLNHIKFNVSSIITIFDDNHHVVYSTKPLSAPFKKQLKEDDNIISTKNDQYVTVSKPLSHSPWTVTVFLSKSELDQKVHWMYIVGLIFAIGGVVLTLFLFFILTRWVISPFKKMGHAMKEVQKGNFDIQLEIEGKDEVARLGDTLNKMITRLNHLINREYTAKLKQRDAENRALRSQIQPHFLFNTINGFMGLNRQNDRKRLEKAFLSLSGMLRYNLEQEDWTTVQKEFLFLEQYCDLQQMRFQEDLDINIHYEEITADCRIPTLLLQPLVENAIIHGAEPLDRPCKISVFSSFKQMGEQTFLLLQVADNGAGFEKKHIFKYSIGIQNVHERINLHFPNALFALQSRVGEGTKVEIEIPVKDVKT